MNTASLPSSITPALAALALTLAATGVQAIPEYGTAVDNVCNGFNGAKPYTAYTSYGTSHCNLCHDPDNKGIAREPEWEWTKAGAEGQKNFCVVQGIIEIPATNLTVPEGGAVDFLARGFSPRGSASPSTYTWTLSDGRTQEGPAWNSVVLPAAGTVTVTLTTKDATNEADATPDQRTIRVSGAPPVANPESYSVQSGATLNITAPGVLANDTGSGKLSAALGTNVAHGFLNLNANGGFTYTPTPSYVGEDYFTYTVTNGVKTSGPATVTLSVTPAPPVAHPDRFIIDPDQANQWPSPGVLANDTGSGTLTPKLVGNTAQGKLVLNADGSFKYTPRNGFKGTDQFSYAISNGSTRSAPATVTLDVGPCRDNDKDGYSPEGGACGPIDCKDGNARINPGVQERCNNQIDDDCNGLTDGSDPACAGKDCVGQLVSSQIQITEARIDDKGKLVVKGGKSIKGAEVSMTDAASGAALGTTKVNGSGQWKFALKGVNPAPCIIEVQINGVSGRQAVEGAPATCSNPGGPACKVK